MKKLLIGCLFLSNIAHAGLIQRTTISSDPAGKLQMGLGYKGKTWSTEANASLHNSFQDVGLGVNQHVNLVMNDVFLWDSFVGAGVKNVIGKKDWFLTSGMSIGLVTNNISTGFGTAWKWDFKKNIEMYPMMNFTVSL